MLAVSGSILKPRPKCRRHRPRGLIPAADGRNLGPARGEAFDDQRDERAAVSRAGGLGLIGGGYGDADWIEDQFDIAGDAPVGLGLISFVLDDQPALLDQVLARSPRALFLSFADPAPFLGKGREVGVPVICQVQTFRDACHAIDLGVDAVVAQGGDAGGHGQSRGTMAFVPEVADEIARRGSESVLCAAGGIADARGVLAALALGADGAMIGTRFWGTRESLVDRRLVEPTLPIPVMTRSARASSTRSVTSIGPSAIPVASCEQPSWTAGMMMTPGSKATFLRRKSCGRPQSRRQIHAFWPFRRRGHRTGWGRGRCGWRHRHDSGRYARSPRPPNQTYLPWLTRLSWDIECRL